MDITKFDQLAKFAREINAAHETAQKLATAARHKVDESLTEALLCGQRLIEVKRIVGHGEFEKWCDQHIKPKKTTRWRYMKLSNVSRVEQLTANGLRQAYIEAGIIGDDAEAEETERQQAVEAEKQIITEELQAEIAEAPKAPVAAEQSPAPAPIEPGELPETPIRTMPQFKLPPLSLECLRIVKPVSAWADDERETFKSWFDRDVQPLIEIRESLN